MPTYEYRCPNGHAYERWEGFDAPSAHPCPDCGDLSRRQISLPAVIFKGPGFYSTDNRRGFASGNGGASSASSDGGTEVSSKENGSGSKKEAAAAD